MKKKLAALFCAAVLAMSLPAMAFAAQFNSPAGTTVTGSNGVALTVKGDVSGNGFIHVEPSSVQASNVPAGVTPIASFEVTADDSISFTELTFVFSVGAQYAGADATIYIQHGDGSTEIQQTKVAADGTITITVDKLSIFSVVIDESTATGSAGVDTSAASPQTGANMNAVAGVTVAAIAGAGVVAFALRKRIAE